MSRQHRSFDPGAVALYLQDGGAAAAMDAGEGFWRDVGEGRIDLDRGWLAMASEMTGDMGHWELHPEGEELLVLLSGALDLVLETPQGEERVRLDADSPAFLMPRGTWHRIEVREPGRMLFVTYGRGTRHKPL